MKTWMMQRVLVLSLMAIFVLSPSVWAEQQQGAVAVSPQGGVLVITDFETNPNNLGGIVAVEGDGAPDWNDPNAINGWYYSKEVAGFNPANVHSGNQSFRLVNGGTGRPLENWATFYLLMGPVMDPSTFPVKIKSFDVSGFSALHFWIKGDKGGERFNVIFRDSTAPNNFPQARFDPVPEGLKTTWQEVSVPIPQVSKFVDTHQVVMIGIEFGTNLGNKKGNIIYIDGIELLP